MKFQRLALMTIFAAIVTAQAGMGPDIDRHHDFDRPNIGIGHVPLQDRAPAFSSPQVEMAPNGDRGSNYPPYYHPERH